MHFRKFVTSISVAVLFGLAACAGAGDKAENSAEEAWDSTEATVAHPANDEMAAEEAVSDIADEAAEAATDEAEAESPRDTVKSASDSLDRPIWCSDVRKRVSAKLCQNYRDQIADLDRGVAAFDPPRDMVKGISREVRLAIGPEEERPRIETMAGNEGQAATADIEIGAKMRARLVGRAFAIDPERPVDLEMGRSRRQVWTWDVTPKRIGKHPLSAEITVLATDGTILNRYPSDLIQVDVTVSQSEAEEIARAQKAKKRLEAEEDIGFLTRMAKLLLEFWWAVVLLLAGLIGGVFYLRNRIKNEDEMPPPS